MLPSETVPFAKSLCLICQETANYVKMNFKILVKKYVKLHW